LRQMEAGWDQYKENREATMSQIIINIITSKIFWSF
jgi:hypothetical protein